MPLNNYLDYAKGADLVKPIIALLDPEGSQNEGSLFRFMRLEQIDDNRCQLTSYLQEDSWGTLFIPSSGIVGESKFLIDGADLKNRLNFEPWSSNPLRIKATKRKAILVECLLNINQPRDLIDHIESVIYSGSVDEFQPPNMPKWSESFVGAVPESIKFRKRVSILNTFSKYQNDKNHRFVWFHIEDGKLAVYGSEYSGGDAGISLMKVAVPITGPVVDNPDAVTGKKRFSMPARHLSRLLHLIDENSPLYFRVSDTGGHVQFWSDKGWFVFPCVASSLSKTLSVSAPIFLNQGVAAERVSQRVYCAQELANKIAMQKAYKKNDPEGVRLECTDSHLVISKLADMLRKDETYALFADLTGDEAPWRPLIVHQSYFLTAMMAALKYCKQLTEEELFETGGEFVDDVPFGEEWNDNTSEDYLMLTNEINYENSHLVSVTQQYLPDKGMWCVYVDPVPYSDECAIYLAANIESKLDDWSEDNI